MTKSEIGGVDASECWESIGVAAARSGCGIETIRFYEKTGVIPKVRRSGNERRIYNQADIARIAFIRRARELGFSLDEIRSLLALAAGSTDACGKVRSIAAHHLDEVAAKIAALTAMQKVLATLVAQCTSGDMRHCPLIDVLSEQGNTSRS